MGQSVVYVNNRRWYCLARNLCWFLKYADRSDSLVSDLRLRGWSVGYDYGCVLPGTVRGVTASPAPRARLCGAGLSEGSPCGLHPRLWTASPAPQATFRGLREAWGWWVAQARRLLSLCRASSAAALCRGAGGEDVLKLLRCVDFLENRSYIWMLNIIWSWTDHEKFAQIGFCHWHRHYPSRTDNWVNSEG